MADLTTTQAAQDLGLSRDTVARYCLEGRFPTAYQLGVGPWRIPPGDLPAFRESQRPKPVTDPHGLEPGSSQAEAARRGAETRNRNRGKKAA